MSRHFEEKTVKMAFVISHFLHFGALKVTVDRFVSRINKLTHSNKIMEGFIHFSNFFSTPSQQHVFPVHLYTVPYKWLMEKIHISKDMINARLIDFNLVLICDSTIRLHLCLFTEGQRSRLYEILVCEFFFFFSNRCQKMVMVVLRSPIHAN